MNFACSLQVRGELQLPCFYGRTLSCTVPPACTGPPCQEIVQIRAATKNQGAAWNSTAFCQNTAVSNSAYKGRRPYDASYQVVKGGGKGQQPNNVLFPTALILCTVLPLISLSPISVCCGSLSRYKKGSGRSEQGESNTRPSYPILIKYK